MKGIIRKGNVSSKKVVQKTSKLLVSLVQVATHAICKLGVARKSKGNHRSSKPSSQSQSCSKSVCTEPMKNHCKEDTTRIRFHDTVSVFSVPSHIDLCLADRNLLWDPLADRRKHYRRNKMEWEADGKKWCDCTEEEDMVLLDGQLVHPFTFELEERKAVVFQTTNNVVAQPEIDMGIEKSSSTKVVFGMLIQTFGFFSLRSVMVKTATGQPDQPPIFNVL